MSYSQARVTDIPDISRLVNSAYRGPSSKRGWTTEADFLDGQRIDGNMLNELLAEPNTIVLLGRSDDRLVCCAELRNEIHYAYLGMVTVAPSLQGRGIGGAMLGHCEDFVQSQWQKKALRISVLVPRHELIQYYVSRGFKSLGVREPFPSDEKYGRPKVMGLELEIYEKVLQGSS